jgi:hypothetical protein
VSKASASVHRLREWKGLKSQMFVGIRTVAAGEEIHPKDGFAGGPKPVMFGKFRFSKESTGHDYCSLPGVN